MLERLRRRAGRGTADTGVQGVDAVLLDAASPADRAIIEQALPYTMTGVARLQGLIDAVRYVVARDLPGTFAECGVWRGGSILTMVLTLQDLGVTDREIYLYDTFEGMTAPTDHDVSSFDPPASETWAQSQATDTRPWNELFDAEKFNKEAVVSMLTATGYPAERFHVHQGPVEDTLPGAAPPDIALLRLDTDWYESTRWEFEHLYPLLIREGVLIVDDYGHWEGCRRATDEYFSAAGSRPFLQRVDYSARMAIKP